MAKLHDTYHLTITTLSPLHIGTGNTLRLGYDYVTYNGKTWVIDSAILADMLYTQDPSDFERMVQGKPAGDLIRPDEYDPASPLFRYVLPGTPRAQSQGSLVQEQIKDAWDRPYIPGSSLKGALRTALAFVGWQEREKQHSVRLDPNQLHSNSKFAAQPLEAQVLFGKEKSPYYDLLRAVQVSDSDPDLGRRLQLINVKVISRDQPGSPIELEAVPGDVTFTATLALDGYLRKSAANSLEWQKDQLLWLKNIPVVVNRFSSPRIAREKERWLNTQPNLWSFYHELEHRPLDPHTEFYLQLGWGGGWDSKTFGGVLTQEPEVFAAIVKKYGNKIIRQGTYQPGNFPKSRRVMVRGEGYREKPTKPLGWIKVKMERV